jgi:hypothetical protein
MSTQPPPPAVHPCDPIRIIRSRTRLLAGLLAALMTALVLVMSLGLRKYPFEHNFHHDIDNPVLAVELASNAHELDTVLHTSFSDGKAAGSVLRTNTYEDCAFIVLYTSFLWFFGTLFAVRVDGSRMSLHLFSGVVIATALADYTENLGIFKALNAGALTDSLAQWICWPSRFKWTLFGVALLLTAVILLRSGNLMYSLATRRLLALGYTIAGTLIVAGPWQPSLIELGTEVFGLVVLINTVALLGPYVSEWIPTTVPVYVDDFCEKKKKAQAEVAVSVRHEP